MALEYDIEPFLFVQITDPLAFQGILDLVVIPVPFTAEIQHLDIAFIIVGEIIFLGIDALRHPFAVTVHFFFPENISGQTRGEENGVNVTPLDQAFDHIMGLEPGIEHVDVPFARR